MTELIVQRDLTELSVVVPVYGCSEALPELHRRLTDVLSSLTDDYEIIFVDDRDPAGAWEILQTLAAKDQHVRAFRLSRNFGQAAAITAGLSKSRGVWTVVMDGDLEEPPEAIPVFYAKALEGYELVRGIRTGWQHGIARRLGSRLFRVMLLESGKSERYGTLSILSRKVVDAYLDLRDTAREYVLMLDWLGFDQATVEFEHAERPYGKSAFTMRKLLSTSFDGVAFRTTAVLRLVIGLGLVVVAAGAALAVYFIYEHFATTNPPGYTSLVVLLLLLSGFVIVSIGVVGVYVGMIFDQVRARPLFILSEQTPSTDLETVEAVRGADA